MTITQLIQSSPAQANELFAKLAGTTNGAVKTRENLFNELKVELELQSRMEEEHLFPVLRKHKETKTLVRAATDDNKQARTLLAELDGMPKDGDEFIAKLTELRKAFQQHVRDEKKELLPAVKAALSNEEAEAITAKVEADKAAAERAKQQAAEQRRAAAREEREKAERRQAQAEARQKRAREEEKRKQAEARQQRAREEEKRQQAEIRAEQRRVREEEKRREAEAEAERQRAREAGAAVARTGERLVAQGQSIAASGAAAAQAGGEAGVRNSQQLAGAVSSALGQTGALIANAVQSYSDRSGPALEQLEVLATLPPVAAGAAAETGKAVFELIGRDAESRARRSRHLLRAFTPQQAAQAQARYVGDTMQSWFEANARMLEISIQAYRGMLQPMARATQRAREARKSA